jgi:tRNA-2-methylthio-N6-dimethylallyladenosine synthase
LDQVRILADRGVRHITLLGQTVNAYRYRLGEKTVYLADLLEMVSSISGIHWVSFLTSYPTERQFEPILQQMAKNPKVCPYLHMPAQSGSDRILAAMNRRYTACQYIDMIEKARAMVPGIAIAGDFIVGFPGETDQDFQQTLALINKVRYKNCFVFKYSPRPGTASSRMEDSVPDQVKSSRNSQLLAAQQQISSQIASSFIGKTVTVLVEGPSKKADRFGKEDGQLQLVGRTNTDWPVVFTGAKGMVGQFVQVMIQDASPFTLFGTCVS